MTPTRRSDERAKGGSKRLKVQRQAEQSSATTLELFFDLVFVFALTQVTALLAHELSPRGVLHGMLVTAIVWWCWVCFSWLGNVVKADVGAARVAVFVAMAGMFVIALTIPEAFHDFDGGLDGPTVFALGYLVVRLVHVVLFTVVSKDDPGLRRQVSLFAGTMTASTVLLLVAARFEGTIETALWAAVILVDYGGTMLIGNAGWRLPSARHFAERHGLIIIVALVSRSWRSAWGSRTSRSPGRSSSPACLACR